MANVLITWELGAGFGHVTRLVPLADALCRMGHRVTVALRDVAATGRMFEEIGVRCLAAPFKLGWPEARIRPARTYAHLLHNVGFADPGELASLVGAWRGLFELTAPDVILCEHSPTALLAARGLRAKRIAVGDGFCIPPDVTPLPFLQPWNPPDSSTALADEARTLVVANRALARHGLPRLDRLASLYHDVDGQLLTTFAELDHFGPRNDAAYFGTCCATLGGEVPWPAGSGPRAFAYVRPFAGLRALVEQLNEQRLQALIYCPGVANPPGMSRGSVTFLDAPVSAPRMAAEADFVIANATHGITAAALLCGRPLFQIPMHQEQQLVASRTMHLGASLAARGDSPAHLASRLRSFVGSPHLAEAAGRFAAKYAGYSAAAAVDAMAQQVVRLVATAA